MKACAYGHGERGASRAQRSERAREQARIALCCAGRVDVTCLEWTCAFSARFWNVAEITPELGSVYHRMFRTRLPTADRFVQ
jgi:hypothetical protein